MEEDEQLRSHVLKSIVKESNPTGGPSGQGIPLCVICLEGISEHARISPCAHEFDFLCIVNWLERNPSCPLCKSRVLAVEYDRTSWQDVKFYTIKHPPPLPAPNTAQSQRSTRNQHHLQQRRQQLQSQKSPERHASHSNAISVDPLAHRKHVYRHQLYSLHVGSNRLSRFQELAPKCFVQDAELVSRARKWIRRELRVFEFFMHPVDVGASRRGITRRVENAEYLLEWIIAMLKSVDIKGSSGQAEDMLQEFLGRDNARLFLHELRAWLRSPYAELQEWDRKVQYGKMAESLQCLVPRAQRLGTERKRGQDVDHYTPYSGSRPVKGRAGQS